MADFYANVEPEYHLELPEEALGHIFSYVDVQTRRNVAVVCRQFYEVLCHLERDRNPLMLGSDQVNQDVHQFWIN